MSLIIQGGRGATADALARTLGGERILHPSEEDLRPRVNWGRRRDHTHLLERGVPVLNPRLPVNKEEELRILSSHGVPCIEILQEGRDFLLRRHSHGDGSDTEEGRVERTSLPPSTYAVRRYPFTREYRVHVFRGLSLRMGWKVPNGEGRPFTEWPRTYRNGWDIHYGLDPNAPQVRELAFRAIEALGMDFGAVDIGLEIEDSQMSDAAPPTLRVIEVNSAPQAAAGLTHERYVAHIRRWLASVGGGR